MVRPNPSRCCWMQGFFWTVEIHSLWRLEGITDLSNHHNPRRGAWMTEERPPPTSSIVAWTVEDAADGDELRRGTWMVGPPMTIFWCPAHDTSNRLIPDRYHLISRKYHIIHGRNRLIPDRYHLIPYSYHLIPLKYRLIPVRY
uniref:Uncharacterized protein n=1 Tax=Oryza glumipatula TaxID=40148 RepID=A0A0E0ARV5_9ORYZ